MSGGKPDRYGRFFWKDRAGKVVRVEDLDSVRNLERFRALIEADLNRDPSEQAAAFGAGYIRHAAQSGAMSFKERDSMEEALSSAARDTSAAFLRGNFPPEGQPAYRGFESRTPEFRRHAEELVACVEACSPLAPEPKAFWHGYLAQCFRNKTIFAPELNHLLGRLPALESSPLRRLLPELGS